MLPEVVFENEAVAREILLPLIIVGDRLFKVIGEGQLVSFIGAERRDNLVFVISFGIIAGYGSEHQGESAVFSELFLYRRPEGIDVGDDAEKAELLGLGQSLIYSIEANGLPSLQVTLRKASAAAHYVLGGPQGNNTNAYSIGTAACEYYVMPGETAANAMYSRKLVKASKAGEDMTPIIDQMNKMIQLYTDKSRPAYCAKMGMVDEIVDMTELRPYLQAFTEAVYQNPKSICPMHQMVTPRACREFMTYVKK